MNEFKAIILWIIVLAIVSGCAEHSQNLIPKNEKDKMSVKAVAILPIDAINADYRDVQLLRTRISEEMFFKGYPKIALEEIDARIGSLKESIREGKTPQTVSDILKNSLNADASMYCTLKKESEFMLIYAPVSITVNCELRNTNTNEVVWKAQTKSVKRNFDFTRRRLEKKSMEGLESLIDEASNKVLETLPDGPNLVN